MTSNVVYSNWLISQITDVKPYCYVDLCRYLHKHTFFSIVDYDQNRDMDGQKLRDRFAEESGLRDEEGVEEKNLKKWIDSGPSSVLEMLVALAIRADSVYILGAVQWFDLFLSNLGLKDFTDTKMYEMKDPYQRLNEILDTFLGRTYSKSGKGGLFPLKKSEKNSREIELWYQLQAYILENFA